LDSGNAISDKQSCFRTLQYNSWTWKINFFFSQNHHFWKTLTTFWFGWSFFFHFFFFFFCMLLMLFPFNIPIQNSSHWQSTVSRRKVTDRVKIWELLYVGTSEWMRMDSLEHNHFWQRSPHFGGAIQR
jgi:hypothetical protein